MYKLSDICCSHSGKDVECGISIKFAWLNV
jgi:hypothetical protein